MNGKAKADAACDRPFVSLSQHHRFEATESSFLKPFFAAHSGIVSLGLEADDWVVLVLI